MPAKLIREGLKAAEINPTGVAKNIATTFHQTGLLGAGIRHRKDIKKAAKRFTKKAKKRGLPSATKQLAKDVLKIGAGVPLHKGKSLKKLIVPATVNALKRVKDDFKKTLF
jgi:hypothetical protein